MNLLSNRFFYFSVFISFGVVVSTIRMSRRRRCISRSFASRPGRSPEEFGALFSSSGSEQTAATIRRLLEKTLKLDLGGLRPEDSFSRELKFDEMSRDTFHKFLGAVEETFDIDLPDVTTCMKMTVAELVQTVAVKTKSAAPSSPAPNSHP